MFIIWGFKTKIIPLAILSFLCGNCGNPSAHHVKRRVTKFELFFIPLFPISSKYFTECTFCGASALISREQADQFVAQAQGGFQQQYPAQGQNPYAQQQQPGYGYPQPQAQQPLPQSQNPYAQEPPRQNPYQG